LHTPPFSTPAGRSAWARSSILNRVATLFPGLIGLLPGVHPPKQSSLCVADSVLRFCLSGRATQKAHSSSWFLPHSRAPATGLLLPDWPWLPNLPQQEASSPANPLTACDPSAPFHSLGRIHSSARPDLSADRRVPAWVPR